MRRHEDGMAALELGLLLPILLLLLAFVVPVVQAGWEYMVVSRAASHGVRYATRVDTNPRMSPAGYLTRRPTAGEVEAFVRDAASPLQLSSVEVSPEPTSTLPDEVVTVRTKYIVSFGPLAVLANSIRQVFCWTPAPVPNRARTCGAEGGTFLPDSKEITVTARGREE
jgi:Flp pilus assembly protein TadG